MFQQDNPQTAPAWTEGYVAVEYEALDRLEDVSHAARSLWLAARVRSSRMASDGLIPCAKLRSVAAGVGMAMRGARSAAAELVNAGAWRQVDATNWQDVGFLTANKSRQFRESQKIKWREQKEKQRANSESGNSETPNVREDKVADKGGGHSDSNVTQLNQTELKATSELTINPASSIAGEDLVLEDEDDEVIAPVLRWLVRHCDVGTSTRTRVADIVAAFDVSDSRPFIAALKKADHRGKVRGRSAAEVLAYITASDSDNPRGSLLGRELDDERWQEVLDDAEPVGVLG